MRIMIKKILLLSSFFCWVWMACTTPSEELGKGNTRTAKTLPKPDPALEFDYLLYDNDYNGVPIDEDPTHYTNKVLDSIQVGLVYQLTNERAFAPGLYATVSPAKSPTWYHLTLRVLKLSKDVRKPLSAKGMIVFSWDRKDSTIHYSTYAINDLLKQQNRQMIDKWETVETWHQVPSDIQEGDLLKIYVWNPEGGTIYIDDLAVTAWSKPAAVPLAISNENTRLLVDYNYEHENPSLTITNKYAHRGVYSNVVGNLTNYSPYGKTYETTLGDQQLEAGDALRIRFAALKQDKLLRSDHVAFIVCSVERNGTNIYWKSMGINTRLWKHGQQLMQEWKVLEWWQVLPKDSRPTDVLKVYVWNNYGTLIYIDDLSIEVVKPMVKDD